MILYPAIDLKDGQCVRLRQGDMDQATVFSDDPGAQAAAFAAAGSAWLHVVDLNGAFAGQPVNGDAVDAILGATDGSFFTGPGGEEFISALSIVGTITFRFFMAAMRRPDLALDPRFATPGARRANIEALKGVVQSWIYSFPDMASLDAQLDEAKIAIGEIRPLEEVAVSEWADYWTATHEVSDRNGGSFRLPGRPWRFSDADLAPPGDPALQGEHNAEVCSELGLGQSAVQELEESGVLVGNFAARMIESVEQSIAADLAQIGAATEEAE